MNHFGAHLELKTVDTMQRIISGYAAYHNNVDRVRDIIDPSASVKAVRRLSSPSDVAVFIGHDSSSLPVGIPLKIEATPEGLYTETKIFDGPVGDNLLSVAKGLHDHGLRLGLSIGYQTQDSKPDRVQGKLVRRLLDYTLKEFSFAAMQAIANPSALSTSVKALTEGSEGAGGMLVPADQKGASSMQYRVEQSNGTWSVICDVDADGDADDNRIVGTYDDEATANAVALALRNEAGGATDDDEAAKTVKAVWSTATQNDLPDSSFLYVAPGGVKDDGGKTVPRANRLFPVKGADGAVDLPHLRNAIARIPDATGDGLDDAKKKALHAKARMMLEKETAGDGKTLDLEAQEWKAGAPLTFRGLGYALLDLSEQLAAEQKAMRLLGEDVKDGHRIRPEVRTKLAEVAAAITKTLIWSETIDRGEDGRARVALLQQRLALTEV